MDEVKTLMAGDRLARFLGIELLEVRPGAARARLQLADQHLNGMGIAHGGALFSLADFVFAAASNSRERAAVALDVSISFLRAVRAGVLYADATEVSCGRRVGVYSVTVTDEGGKPVALFKGTAYRKDGGVGQSTAQERGE